MPSDPTPTPTPDPEGTFACPLCGLAEPHRHHPAEVFHQLAKTDRIQGTRGAWKSAYPLVVLSCWACGALSFIAHADIYGDGYPVRDGGNTVMRCEPGRMFYRFRLSGWDPQTGQRAWAERSHLGGVR